MPFLTGFIKEKRHPNRTVTVQIWDVIHFGAANQIRTGDLILTKDVLYHLSHSSKLTLQRIVL